MTEFNITTDPLVSENMLLLIGLLCLGFLFYAFALILRKQQSRFAFARLLMAALLFGILMNPSLRKIEGDQQPNIALIVLDQSPSQSINQRAALTDAVAQELDETLSAMKAVDVRLVSSQRAATPAPSSTKTEAPRDTAENDRSLQSAYQIKKTRLFQTINQALTSIPQNRLAGIILITDGQIHDIPQDLNQSTYGVPIHTLLTGSKSEKDRQIKLINAPSYGIVGQDVTVTLRVSDLPTSTETHATVYLRDNLGLKKVYKVPVGRDYDLTLNIDHGGQNVFEFEVQELKGELSLINNKTALIVNGVRDRLKVLLVSGSPHAGERTWRNLLKADPSVDLVHFTILRPSYKGRNTPSHELSLIAFPVRELFEVKLKEFDLIIFDRYKRMNILPPSYLQNIVDYVQNGGAFLEASGPSFASSFSMYTTPLGKMIPAKPGRTIYRAPFRPELTKIGHRHPVTTGLETRYTDAAGKLQWGHWFRQLDLLDPQGNVLLSGYQQKPLLVLNHFGKGRVAQLGSDQIWLWSRGYEGGGPQAELLRRLAHWLMKEPDLEENNLTAAANATGVSVERKYLTDYQKEVTMIAPDGHKETLELQDVSEDDGIARADFATTQPGIYRFSSDGLSTVAILGAINPPELQDLRATDRLVARVKDQTGGGVLWLEDIGNKAPTVRFVDESSYTAGRSWIGLWDRQILQTTTVSRLPLLPGFLALFLSLTVLIFFWWREGRSV